MCCAGGAHLSAEAAETIQTLSGEKTEQFAEMGLDLPEAVVCIDTDCLSKPDDSKLVDNQFCQAGYRTAFKPFQFSTSVEDYPAHFNRDLACVFLLEDGRCGLQVLAEQEGRHPWYYKPIECWIFPIYIIETENGVGFYLPNPETDPWRRPDYPGYIAYSFCGRAKPCGRPAYELLEPELTILGQIVERDFAAEMRNAHLTPTPNTD
jgi:hypothetical protein